MAFLEVRGLEKRWSNAVALRGVDLAVDQGEWCAVVGPSGSGKTTLLNVIGGLERPTTGEILLEGEAVSDLGEDELAAMRRSRIGLVFQQAHLVPYLDAVENVMLAQFFHSMPDEDEAIASLERVGLGSRLRHRPSELSGGEQQRVCIARALINEPPLVLADEPTGNLDQDNTDGVLALLRELHERRAFAMLLVTHDAQVAAWAPRKVTLEDGRVVADERSTG